jgi:hypothetical protein
MRYSAMSPRDDTLQVQGGPANLWCCGEKAGLLVGHTEAMVTGALAGHNAVRWLAGIGPLQLPVSLAVGDAVTHVREQMATFDGLAKKYTFSGSVYFERMKQLDLYTTDSSAIDARVRATGLAGVLAHKVT